jgi:hypothetical protein
MPTIMVVDGFRLHFFSNEGPRPHIHVARGDGSAKIWLDDLSFADWDDLTAAERRRILKITEENRARLLDAWNEYFGS